MDWDDRVASYALSAGDYERAVVVPQGDYGLSDELGGPKNLPAFSLDVYPVTVARFEAFIDAGGYQDESLWDEDGWLWARGHKISQPRFWREEDWEEYMRPDRPVVGVSWYEAQAFCRHVGRRLPTEAQWEAAARGPQGSLFPWGQQSEDHPVGNRGVGLRCTWPVGFWEQAVGPFGHYDLVGNVWQWTTDPYLSTEPQGRMAVRGGSWASRQEHCRSDHRNGYTRDGQWSHVGFRTTGDVE